MHTIPSEVSVCATINLAVHTGEGDTAFVIVCRCYPGMQVVAWSGIATGPQPGAHIS